jgi:hypothetical protein
MKSVYVIQPYQVGSKRAKSLAMVIPAKIVREYNINASTIFTLKPDHRNEIRLHVLKENKKTCDGESKEGIED